jgi:hypothetical protein
MQTKKPGWQTQVERPDSRLCGSFGVRRLDAAPGLRIHESKAASSRRTPNDPKEFGQWSRSSRCVCHPDFFHPSQPVSALWTPSAPNFANRFRRLGKELEQFGAPIISGAHLVCSPFFGPRRIGVYGGTHEEAQGCVSNDPKEFGQWSRSSRWVGLPSWKKNIASPRRHPCKHRSMQGRLISRGTPRTRPRKGPFCLPAVGFPDCPVWR